MKNKRNTIALSIIAFITAVAVAVIFLVGFGDLSKGDDLTDDKEVTEKQDTDVDKENDNSSDNHNNDEDEDEGNEGIFEWYDHAAAPTQEEYGALQNGDTFYTPDGTHLSFDDDRAVLYYDNVLIVYTFDDLSMTDIDEVAELVDGETVGVVKGGIHSLQIKVAETNLAGLESLCNTLMKDSRVMYACAEYPVQIMGTQNNNPWDEDDTERLGNEEYPGGSDWWAEAIGAYTAWEFSQYCQEMNIGIVDTGVDDYHEDLYGKVAFIGENTVDSMDHGTHVAGIMSAYDNDIGIRGIADGLNLYSADLWTGADSESSFHTIGELMAIYNNMAYNDVRVINNSWGCYIFEEHMYKELMEGNALPYDEWHETRVNDLVPTAEATIVMMSQLIASGNENMIFVQAAGNGYYGYYYEPADSITNGFFGSITEDVYNGLDGKIKTYLNENGITYDSIDERIYNVTAVNYYYDDDEIVYELSDFANYGDTVDICAPGSKIYSTINEYGEQTYAYFDGTSMAAPMVTASIGFIWSLNPDMSVSRIREVMFDSSQREVSCEIDGKVYTYPMINVGIAAQIVAGD